MKKPIRILLADDHLVVRMGLAAIVNLEDDMELVGEAGNGEEAVRLAKALKPDIVVMDLMMPVQCGADATAIIARELPEAKILVLTTFSDSGDVRRALAAGAVGAIVKDSSHDELIAAIRAVASGERVISPEIANAISAKEQVPQLAQRHVEILRYAAKGLSYSDISKLLDIGVDCIKAHMKTAFARLNAANRSEAVAIAIRLGIIDP